MYATSLPPDPLTAAVIDAELRAQRSMSLSQWAERRGVPYIWLAQMLEGSHEDHSGVLDELAADLGVAPRCLRAV